MRVSKISAAVVLALAVATLHGSPAQAAVPTFKNCTAMHTRYVGGVGKPGAIDHRRGGGHAKYAPYRNLAIYTANARMDADHDGIACEQ